MLQTSGDYHRISGAGNEVKTDKGCPMNGYFYILLVLASLGIALYFCFLDRIGAFIGLAIGVIIGAGIVWFVVNYYCWRAKQLRKPFNKYTTNEEAINGLDMTGKIAVITGSNNGIGKETTRILVKQGCTVYMACRSVAKANDAKNDIVRDLGLDGAESERLLKVEKLDLSSLASVKQFADEFNAKNLKINYLINNAGIMALPEYRESADGIEMQFATNHLGHFYLTNLLLPSLLKPGDGGDRMPRVITLSSTAHRDPRDYDWMMQLMSDSVVNRDFMGSRRDEYHSWRNYGISKTSNILFTYELQKRYGDRLIAVCVHPGGVSTGLSRHLTFKEIIDFFKLLAKKPSYYYINFKPLECGAGTSLRCVSLSDGEIRPAHYYANCDEANYRLESVPKAALTDGGKMAAKVWELSEVLIEAKGFSLKP